MISHYITSYHTRSYIHTLYPVAYIMLYYIYTLHYSIYILRSLAAPPTRLIGALGWSLDDLGVLNSLGGALLGSASTLAGGPLGGERAPGFWGCVDRGLEFLKQPTNIYMYVYTHMRMYVYIYMYVYMYVFMYVYAYMCIYRYICTYT